MAIYSRISSGGIMEVTTGTIVPPGELDQWAERAVREGAVHYTGRDAQERAQETINELSRQLKG